MSERIVLVHCRIESGIQGESNAFPALAPCALELRGPNGHATVFPTRQFGQSLRNCSLDFGCAGIFY